MRFGNRGMKAARHIGDVVCAVIECDGKILIARRPAGKDLALKWEFPGGKVQAGESETDALHRELFEELRIGVEVLERMTPVEHCYADFSLRLIPFRCRIVEGLPVACNHEELALVSVEELSCHDFPDADLPVIEEYRMKMPCRP